MELYEIKKGSRIYADLSDGSKYLVFDHLDGMYSYCKTEKGGVTNLSRFTPLVEYKDGYKIRVKEKYEIIEISANCCNKIK